MLREHTNSPNIRNAPPPPIASSAPSIAYHQKEDRSLQLRCLQSQPLLLYLYQNASWPHLEDDDFFRAESIEDLTTGEIEMIRAASLNSDQAQDGKLPLHHPKLKNLPLSGAIRDRFSSVLGDPFHAIQRPGVPMHHEHKKVYKVAFQNALFVWNRSKLEELENEMQNDGMTEAQIEAARYYNGRFHQSCIERTIPSPKLLYWRVRAVFVMHGSSIDSKSGKPQFNDDAWSKANNLLEEILRGYYLDPPGEQMYTMKLNLDGSVKRNKYGKEKIECSR
ncbi:hypothetical protein ACHAWF_010649 [Thalassiosira exigua]